MNEINEGPAGTHVVELDPARSDPGYWAHFQDRVMARALPELARRRRQAHLSVVDVVHSWSRLLVPAAVAAAAVAGMLLMSDLPGDTEAQALTVAGIEDMVLPLQSDEEAVLVFLMSEDPPDAEELLWALEDY